MKHFQSRHTSHAPVRQPTRWLVDPVHAALLERIEQTTLSTMVAGCSPEEARGAVIESLAGRDVQLQHLTSARKRSLTRMLDSIRAAGNAKIDPELVVSVCTDAMDVGQLLREAFTQGFEAGRATDRRPAALH